jgi:phosphoribosyl-AMP cyclohydrolase / phosphoribosyl-ATP pyrophosphohydrolase
MHWLDEIKFDGDGLVPVVTQEVATGEVLMLAHANRDALERSAAEGRAVYWSRSRRSLWRKGDTSGHVQQIEEIRVDCDGDAVLYRVRQTGPACHTGEGSCFHRAVEDPALAPTTRAGHILSRVEAVIAERHAAPREGSYTNYLLEAGTDKILKKIGEEATEVVIAAKNGSEPELASETADLLFHLAVLFRDRNLDLGSVWKELETRFGRAPRARTTRPDRKA